MRLLIVFFIMSLFYTCKYDSKGKHNIAQQNSSINTDIIEEFPEIPFIISKPPINVPDSLGGSNIKGLVIIQTYVDSNGKLLDFKIRIIRMKNLSDEIIIDFNDFTNSYNNDGKDKYPSKIKKYINWINSYINKVKFIKKENVKVSKENVIYLPIKIKP